MQLLLSIERIIVKTISIKINGIAQVSNHWIWTIDGSEHSLTSGETSFTYIFEKEVEEGWNKFVCTHSIDNHNDLHTDGHSYSYLNLSGIYIDNVFCKKELLQASGTVAQSLINDKQLFMKELGEPFTLECWFYYPLEQWSFALLDSKPEAKYGPYFITH